MTDIAELIKAHTEGVELKFADYQQLTTELKARLDELEQKGARRGGGEPAASQSIGEQFVAADGVKDFAGYTSRPTRFSMEIKSTITSAAGAGGELATPYRDTVLTQPKRALVVRDLLPTIQISTGSVEYPRVTAGPSAATTVAEGALKPEAAMTTDLVTVPIRTIAHWVPASRQILEDSPQLRGIIDTELVHGLNLVEDNQLLNGAGTGTDLSGIYTLATTMTANPGVVANPTKIDAILYAILQNALNNLPATGIVLHPSDWTAMRAIKDSQGAYLLGDPQGAIEPRLFGLPVVQSLAQAAGTFLVGDFATSATLYDRWLTRVEISTEHADFFVRNLVAILAEKRLGLAVKRPLGFTKGTFATVITDLTS